jgi:hypothetical protein
MGVTPARNPGPWKTDSNVGKIKSKPNKGKAFGTARKESGTTGVCLELNLGPQ